MSFGMLSVSSIFQLYMYQLFRSLAYIHSLGICHRDIKPQNLLMDTATGVLKLCDFGSAKLLVRGEPNVSYICSRYYRAPELIFGATNYTTKIGVYLIIFIFDIDYTVFITRLYFRCLECGLRDGRTTFRATNISW